MVGLLSIGVRSATGPAMEQQQARSMHTSIAHSVHIKQPNSRPGPQAPQAHVGPNDGRHHSAAAFKTRHEMKTGGGGRLAQCSATTNCTAYAQSNALVSHLSFRSWDTQSYTQSYSTGRQAGHFRLHYKPAGRKGAAVQSRCWRVLANT